MKYKLEVPTVPNFIRAKVGETQVSISISELDDEDIAWLAEQWKIALIAARGLRKK